MPSEKLPGTEDTVAESAASDDTLAAPPESQATQPRARNDSGLGVRTPTTIGDSLRGANIESFDSVDRRRYEVLGEMARGGLGRVMRARDPRTGRIVALKEIIVPNRETIARFAREALVTANLQHPSIVPVYEVGRWPNGDPFYAMKLVQGRTLSELIGKAKTAAERMALLPHAIAVADALAYAHSEHVIHRDLKPGNVLVGSYGETVVIDWGLARNTATGQEVGALSNPSIDLGTDTIIGTVIGTPSYMPPEQALGAPIDEGADVYAIGALMYHMLSGARPYADAKTVEEVVERVKSGPPAPLATLAPETPPELIAIVEKAMSRTLAGRYRSAEGLAEDLRRFQTGKLVGAHRYTKWQLVQRWIRKYSAVLGVAGAALIVLGVVAVISVKRIAQERDLAQEQRGLAVERFASSLEELARQAALAGAPDRAAAILAGMDAGHRTPALGILAGQARAAYAGLVGIAPAQVKYTLSAAITRDGTQLFVTSGEHKLVAWQSGAQRWMGEAAMVALAPDDHSLLVALGSTVRLLAPADGKQLAQWDLGEEVALIQWTAKGDRFAVAGDAGAIAIGTLGGALVPGEHHGKHVTALAFSADDARLASVANDGVLIVQGGAAPKRLAEGKGELYGLAWLDATHVVAGGQDHVARLWNTETGAVERTFDHGVDILGVVRVAADLVATYGYEQHIKIWPVAGGAPRVLQGDRGGVNVATMLGDALIAGDAIGQAAVWDPRTGERQRVLPIEGVIDDLVVRGDLLVELGELRTRIWHLDPGAIVRQLRGATARMRQLTFARGELWVASNDGTARSFGLDGATRLVLGKSDFSEPIVTGPGDPNAKAPPNPHGARYVVVDGDRVATAYEDGRIVIWDAATGAQRATWTGHTGRVRALAFAGAVAYSAGDTTVRKWDVATGAELAHADLGLAKGELAWGVAVHGDVVVTSTDKDRIALWSAANLAPGPVPAVVKDRLSDLAFADELLVVADTDRLGLLDLHTGKLAVQTQRFISTAANVGPSSIAVGSTQSDVTLFDRTTLATLSSWRTGDDLVTIVRFRPDGKIVATSGGNTVRIWDPATGSLLAERTELPTYITRMEWSPDGTHLAFGGLAPMVWLWDLTPAEPADSCALTMRLADAALVVAPPAPAWCVPTSR